MKGRRVPESVATPGGVPLPSGVRFTPIRRLTPEEKALAKHLARLIRERKWAAKRAARAAQ